MLVPVVGGGVVGANVGGAVRPKRAMFSADQAKGPLGAVHLGRPLETFTLPEKVMFASCAVFSPAETSMHNVAYELRHSLIIFGFCGGSLSPLKSFSAIFLDFTHFSELLSKTYERVCVMQQVLQVNNS